MNVSYRWLQSIAPSITEPPRAVSDRLAMLGFPVDELVAIGEQLRDVVIGRTVSVQQHPNADRLSLCEVDAGGEILKVVCGAPNVRANAFYPFAPVGASLPGNVTIRKAKIRGSESQGMLCSARELELGRDHDGILELHGEFTPGESFIDAVGLNDTRIVIDVTPNRGDMLSHWGVAREIAPGGQADLKLDLKGQPLNITVARNDGRAGAVHIRIEDSDACPRYIGVAIDGVRVGPSPEWLATRLRAIGSRPINNIVDATNYVLHELGQPLHAFDRDRLGGSQIVVRRARAGETLTTLDGVARKLEPSMLVIADGDRASAVAGVMGGRDSEVSEQTTNVLLECAFFESKQVRQTRTTLGLPTDASSRFERGVDRDMMLKAVQRAAELIVATAGGAVAGGIDVHPKPPVGSAVMVRPARVSSFLGRRFQAEEVTRLLDPIGFTNERVGTDMLVEVPTHRVYDVALEVDVIEEVARRFGYDNFARELLPFRPSSVPEDALAQLEEELRTLLVGRGFIEARTAAFAPESEGDVALMHPLSSAESRLRRALLPALMKRVEYNFYRGVRDVRLFEIGTAFATGRETPEESTRLAVVFTGARTRPHWTLPAEEFDVWDAKGLLTAVAHSLGIDRIEIAEAAPDTVIGRSVQGVLATNATFAGTRNGEAEIVGGRLRSDYIDAPAWAGAIFGFEAVLPASGYARGRISYIPLAQFPAIEQDIALVVPEGLASAAIESTIRSAGGAYLEDVFAFDLYRGPGIAAGSRSIAYRLRFRAQDRTLTDADADNAVRKVITRLKEEHGVERRS